MSKRKAFVLEENVSTYLDYLNGVNFGNDDSDEDYDPEEEDDLVLIDELDDVDNVDVDLDDELDYSKIGRRFRVHDLRKKAICEDFLVYWTKDNDFTLEEYCTNPAYYACGQELEDPLHVETVRKWFKKFDIGSGYRTRRRKVRTDEEKKEFIERSFDSDLDWDKF